MQWQRFHRKVHYWGAFACALPVLLVILTGILLLLKKESDWIQPPTMTGTGTEPSVAFSTILETARSVPETEIEGWQDVDRLDVRPGKGIVKVRAKNRWEVQIDHQTGELKSVAYRRSELIESLHDGSFFHPAAKLRVFLPAALVLLTLWLTGIYLFAQPFLRRRRQRS
jgi:uncharacterized iron-regulated membrane protein